MSRVAEKRKAEKQKKQKSRKRGYPVEHGSLLSRRRGKGEDPFPR